MIEGFKNIDELRKFENRLKEINITCYLVWKIGVNLALRVSDVLKMETNQAERYIKKGIYISKDKKTGKDNQVKLNENTILALKEAVKLRKTLNVPSENPFLFIGTGNRVSKSIKSISRQAIDKYFKQAVADENIDISIGTHTMRKTWGALAYSKGVRVGDIMKRLRHSSEETTLIYLGITDKEMDEIVANLNI